MFDSSEYPENPKSYDTTKEKLLEGETKNIPIVKFGELKSKIYSFIKKNMIKKKKGKKN